MKNQKGFSAVAVLLIVVVVGLISGVGWYVYKSQNKPKDTQQTADSNKTATENKEEVQDPDQYTPPEGWKKYSDKENTISFYYPASWDSWNNHKFNIDKVAVEGKLYVQGGQGSYHYFNFKENKWYQHESDYNGTKSSPSNLEIAESTQTKYPAGFMRSGEGGGIWYFLLITDGKSSYQVVLPTISEENGPEERIREEADAIKEIIKSIRFYE